MVQYNNYTLGTGPDLLYTVNGEACDWMYGEKHIFSYTPEIGENSDGFWPSTNRIVPLAEENLYPNQVLAVNAGSKYDRIILARSKSQRRISAFQSSNQRSIIHAHLKTK